MLILILMLVLFVGGYPYWTWPRMGNDETGIRPWSLLALPVAFYSSGNSRIVWSDADTDPCHWPSFREKVCKELKRPLNGLIHL